MGPRKLFVQQQPQQQICHAWELRGKKKEESRGQLVNIKSWPNYILSV